MKRVLILGATGGVGRRLLPQIVEAGHSVTVFVRSLDKINVDPKRLRVFVGDTTRDASRLAEAVDGQEAVISALGRGSQLTSGDLIQRSVRLLLPAMTAHHVRRLIFTSAIGVGNAYGEAPLLSRLFIRFLLKDLYVDKIVGEDLIRQSSLDWTIVQPAGLTNGALTRKYRAAEHLKHRLIPTISRADVAEFLVRQLDDTTYIRKIVQQGY